MSFGGWRFRVRLRHNPASADKPCARLTGVQPALNEECRRSRAWAFRVAGAPRPARRVFAHVLGVAV